MTAEECAASEIREIGQWLLEESAKVFKELNDKYGEDLKIDANAEAYKKLHEEFADKMQAVKEKYNL